MYTSDCYGWFDEFCDYCWYCPYASSCYYYTYGEQLDDYY